MNLFFIIYHAVLVYCFLSMGCGLKIKFYYYYYYSMRLVCIAGYCLDFSFNGFAKKVKERKIEPELDGQFK